MGQATSAPKFRSSCLVCVGLGTTITPSAHPVELVSSQSVELRVELNMCTLSGRRGLQGVVLGLWMDRHSGLIV